MMAEGDWALSDGRPYAAGDRLQPNAMFVHCLDFDRGLGMLALLLGRRDGEVFFERGTVIFGCRVGMSRPGLLDRIADRDQRVPAALVMHRFERVIVGKPARDLRPAPQPAIVGRRLGSFFQRSQRRRRENRRLRSVVGAPIAQGLGTILVVAPDQLPNPARREREQLRDLFDLISRGQQPQCMKVALGKRIGRLFIALFKLEPAQMRLQRSHDCAPADES